MNNKNICKKIIKKTTFFVIMFILMCVSILPIHANEYKELMITNQTFENNSDNILGYITIEYESFWVTGRIRDLKPIINFTQSDNRFFYFDEIDGFIQMNFTVVCKTRIRNNALFPRLTRFELYMPPVPSEEYFYYVISPITRIKRDQRDWVYSNITVGMPENQLYTNGSSAVLTPQVGTRPFPTILTSLMGVYETWEPITVIPI